MKILVLILMLCICGCVTPMVGGFNKPTIMTKPMSYLDNFSLGSVTKGELISNCGIPDKTNEYEGKTYLTYEVGQGYGKRQFVYILSNDVIVDVQYHDQGPYNASSAMKRQINQKR